jgi:tRNA (cmo5U34)-methyltransferase
MTQQQPDQSGVVLEVPGHHWMERDRVDEYVERTTRQADERRVMFDQMCDLFLMDRNASIRVLDIGAGYGAVAEAVLDWFPNATAVGLDISEPMMEVGRERMARFGNRFSYHVGDFAEGDLPADLPAPFDAVVASASIHHLPSAAKRKLYSEIFGVLRPGGAFFNQDQVAPEEEDLKEWYRARRARDEAEGHASPRRGPSAHGVMTQHHIETAKDQIAWLRHAGFVQVDVYYKNLRQTIIGGYKPRA